MKSLKLYLFKILNIAVISCFICMMIALCFWKCNNYFVAEASEGNSVEELYELCEDYTNDLSFTDEFGVKHSLCNYPDYVASHFDVDNYYNDDTTIEDEWIGNFVPLELFDLKTENFLYIGKTFGFYFCYNKIDDTYLIYFIRNNFKEEMSGQLSQTIIPYYYEKYTYDENTGRIAIQYYDEYVSEGDGSVTHIKCYKPYSKVKNLYLKDISFSANLYNVFHFNQFENGYEAAKDNGGYFYGNYYKFKGVSTQSSGAGNYLVDTFVSALGFSDTLGTVLNVFDIVSGTADFIQMASEDFREIRTNEDNIGIKFMDSYPDYQIEKYNSLMKSTYSYLESPNDKNAVLIGINEQSYVTNTFFIAYANHSDRWNTSFASKVSFDVVEEDSDLFGSSVREIASSITSNQLNYYFDNGEVYEVTSGEDNEIYLLQDYAINVNFTAPLNGIYTFYVSDQYDFDFADYAGGEIISQTQTEIVVYIKQDTNFKFSISIKNNISSKVLSLTCLFTPNGLNVGGNMAVNIDPGETEYVRLVSYENTACDVSISGESIVAGIYVNGLTDIVGTLIDENEVASYFINKNNVYYLAIHNDSTIKQQITVTTSQGEILGLDLNRDYNIQKERYMLFDTPVSSYVEFAIDNSRFVAELYTLSEFKYLAGTSSTENSFNVFVDADQFYVLHIKKISSADDSQVNLKINFNPNTLQIGENIIKQQNDEMCYKFATYAADAKYSISTSAYSYMIYDAEWVPVDHDENIYNLNKDSVYYIVIVCNDQNEFMFTIDLYFSNNTRGVLPAEGEVLVKFVPQETGKYTVEGNVDVVWYDNRLNTIDSNLQVSGLTYYVRISGERGTEYNIKLEKEFKDVVVNRKVNLFKGDYKFNISEDGLYGFYVYCTPNVSVSIDIFNVNGQLIEQYSGITGNFAVELLSGEYYFTLEISDDTSIGFVIVPRQLPS